MPSLLSRVPTLDFSDDDTQTYNDKYVVLYDFSGVDYDTATKEFTTLLTDLEETGLHTEVRAGYEQTLLVFVKAPRELLGNNVYKSRVKDWLYGIVPDHPGGTKSAIVKGEYEAEDLLSMYHLVHWPKELGGAGVTPELGGSTSVKAIFPLHNKRENRSLLRHLSKRIFLTAEDLDSIRDLFGSKVAFYFAFIQTYLVFLSFPAITGIAAWLWLPKYSLAYAILTCVWCAIFLEYWKVQEIDLSIRWKVRGIHNVKVNRPQFKWERVVVDESGRKIHYFPKWKSITRQLLQIPFGILATVALGAIIVSVFAIEVLISETYEGAYKFYLEYLPTVLLAVALPYISSYLEDVATWLTEFENHRTADYHEMSQTQKIFVLNIITNYLPILLTAFVYVPFGDDVVPWLEVAVHRVLLGMGQQPYTQLPFEPDADRLRNEVIALTVTGQLASFFTENLAPPLKRVCRRWWRDARRRRGAGAATLAAAAAADARADGDDAAEAALLRQSRYEATLAGYNVQEDIGEIVLQFGYLALFSPVWPLIPFGFLLNNWVELRSDFAKICIEHQRPAPVRTDGIGPWVGALEFLTWLGSLSTAAIVHLFGAEAGVGGGGSGGGGSWMTLPITVFVSEHVLLALRSLVRFVLQRAGSEQIRRQRGQQYANRARYLEELEANKRAGLGLSVAERERRKSVLALGGDTFWTRQVEDGVSAAVGIGLIRQVKQAEDAKTKKRPRKLD